jgi:hypothetical protein
LVAFLLFSVAKLVEELAEMSAGKMGSPKRLTTIKSGLECGSWCAFLHDSPKGDPSHENGSWTWYNQTEETIRRTGEKKMAKKQ